MTDPLERVAAAAADRQRAEQQYRLVLAAVVDELSARGARDAFSQVARAAGVSRQAVRQLLLRRN